MELLDVAVKMKRLSSYFYQTKEEFDFIPEIVDYLRLELSEYFRVHETINMEMAKQRELEVNK